MGVDMVTMTLTLPLGRDPDWDAMASALRDVRLERLWATGDELFPWEWYLDPDEVGNLPGAEAAFYGLRSAQRHLRNCADSLRGALEHDWPEELIVLDTPTHHVWVTGGPSSGMDPTDLFAPAMFLAESGIAHSAGFDDFTHYCGGEPGDRRFAFSARDLRLVCFGVAAAHVSEQAAALDPCLTTQVILERCAAALTGVERDDYEAGPALVRLAAHALALDVRLHEGDRPLNAQRLGERARELCRAADGGDLDALPRRRSRRRVRDHLARLIEAPEVERTARGRRGRAGRGPSWLLLAAVGALVDLYGAEVAGLLDVAPRPIACEPPPPSESRFAPLSQYLSLVLEGGLDWVAADAAVCGLHPEVREQRQGDLVELRRLIEGDDYWRWATSDLVGRQRVWIAAPHGDPDRPDVANAIGRLGRDGVLDAAGAQWWSAPDPSYRGPVESFVPGLGPRRR